MVLAEIKNDSFTEPISERADLYAPSRGRETVIRWDFGLLPLILSIATINREHREVGPMLKEVYVIRH